MLSRRFSFATTTRRIALAWSVIIESQRQNCPVGRNKEKFPNIRSNVLEILNVSSMFHTLNPLLIDLPLPLITSGVRSIPREGSVRIPGGRRGRRADGASSGPGHPSSPWPLARKRPRDRHVVGTLKTRRREETIINKVPLLPRKLWFTQNKLFRYPPVAAIIIRITIYEMLPALPSLSLCLPVPISFAAHAEIPMSLRRGRDIPRMMIRLLPSRDYIGFTDPHIILSVEIPPPPPFAPLSNWYIKSSSSSYMYM